MPDPSITPTATPADQAVAAALPSGYQAYMVGGQVYVAYTFDPGMGATATLYFQHDQQDTIPVENPQLVDEGYWTQLSGGWVNGRSTAGLISDPSLHGYSWDQIVDRFLYESGLHGTTDLADPTVLTVAAEWFARPDMGETELANRLAATDTAQSRTARQKAWNDFNPVEQQTEILAAAQGLMPLWESYIGETLDWVDYDTDGRGVTAAELAAANPDLSQWATAIASGQSSQATAVNEWIKPLAAETPNSPHLRRLEAEQKAQGQRDVNVATNRGTVVDLYNQYGIDISEARAAQLGEQMYMNDLAYEDLEDTVKNEAQTVWQHKPRDMDFKTWANPFLELYAMTLETTTPTFRDPMVAQFLQGDAAPNLSAFKRQLRSDERWQYTQNARDDYHRTYTEIGKIMGFN